MQLIYYRVLVLLVILACRGYASDKPREIDWDDLVPALPRLDNPFERLTTEQIMDFEILIGIRDFQRNRELSEINETFEDGIEIRYKLEREGLDVEGLMVNYERLEQEVERRNMMTNAELDGQTVRIPGYALPLEHQDTGVKELLLVPYVGACIHVPPPPANQTIYVQLGQAHTFKDIYEPVWITGRLSIKASNRILTLVDGSAGVDTGYTLQGVKIEPYEKN